MFNIGYQHSAGIKLCRYFFSKTGCKFKNYCLFSHLKPVNWIQKDCWFYLNGICVFGKKCFNYHRNKNEQFKSHDQQKEKGSKKKYNPKSSKIVNKQFVSRTHQIKFSNVKENNGETQAEDVVLTKNTKEDLKYESYSILKREIKRLKLEVKYLKIW